MTRRRTPRHLTRVIVAAAVSLVVALGVGASVLQQKQAERRDYAAVLAGKPCTAVSRTPDYVAQTPLKSLHFDGAAFQYVRGDADCQTVRPGRLLGDEEVPVCLFDRPGFVEVSTGSARAAYVIDIGQASVLVAPHGPRCAVQPSP